MAFERRSVQDGKLIAALLQCLDENDTVSARMACDLLTDTELQARFNDLITAYEVAEETLLPDQTSGEIDP